MRCCVVFFRVLSCNVLWCNVLFCVDLAKEGEIPLRIFKKEEMMKLEKFEVEIKGITPLIIQNCQAANPLNSYYKKLKEVTSKRKKTEEDHEAILKIQWEASLYWSDMLGLYMPWENLSACLLKAAKSHKMGQKMGGISFTDPIGYEIQTKNHKDLEALKRDADNKFVKMVTIQRSKTLSCRPIFNDWNIDFSFESDPNYITANEVKTILLTAQSFGGLGVWRPTSPQPGPYGKFTIKKINYTNSSGETKNLGEKQ